MEHATGGAGPAPDAPPPPPPDLPAALLAALFRVARALRSATSGDGVDGPLLVVLSEAAGSGQARLADLASSLGLDASTVSRHVRALTEAGLLARAGDPADRRAARVSITPAGRRALEAGLRRRRALLDVALADWAPGERETLANLVARLADDLAAPRCGAPERAARTHLTRESA